MTGGDGVSENKPPSVASVRMAFTGTLNFFIVRCLELPYHGEIKIHIFHSHNIHIIYHLLRGAIVTIIVLIHAPWSPVMTFSRLGWRVSSM